MCSSGIKILVCGVGSIGERHIRNLLSSGYEDIVLYRKRNLPLRTIYRTFPVFDFLYEALKQKPDVAFICNPTHLHMETAIACVEAGCHVFVEKPLSHTLEGIDQLSDFLEKQKRQLMVGYMLRFHPCLNKIKSWLDDSRIGNLVYLRSQWGEYLPDWHPYEDYRESYAAQDAMGGGPALTLSHDLDCLLWLAGEYKSVLSLKNTASELTLSTEHGIDVLIEMTSGATANIHLDYFQSPPSRCLEIVGTRGRIVFDYYKSRVERFELKRSDLVAVFDISESFDRNQLFVSEVKYFFRAIEEQLPVVPGIHEGSQVVKLATDIKRGRVQ